MSELIILPCHSIWKGGSSLGQEKEEWFLAPFQFEGNDHHCFVDHIKTSFKMLRAKANAILVISGGQTKAEAGPVSESQSYLSLLIKMFPHDVQDLSRIVTEEFARDSLENVVFSICRFREVSGTYPSRITIVGFEFKKERFITCHLKHALSFPEDRILYIGNNPTPNEQNKIAYFENLETAERDYARIPFTKDPYGIRNPLRTKRLHRDPFRRHHTYGESNPQLASFLKCIQDTSHCESDSVIRNKIRIDWKSYV